MKINDLATIVINTCFKIHQQYGPGLLESVYEEILSYELQIAGLKVSRQQAISLIHEDLVIKIAFRADLIIEDILLVELKAVDDIPKVYYRKVLTYLKLTDLRLGLLINFSVSILKDGIHRIANNL